MLYLQPEPAVLVLLLLLAGGCALPSTAAEPAAVAPAAPPPAVAPAADAPPPEARCLPVVAADCGCVYSCGAGVPQANGLWLVTHEFWGSTPLTARIASWCVDGACTDAFHAEVVCSGVCAP